MLGWCRWRIEAWTLLLLPWVPGGLNFAIIFYFIWGNAKSVMRQAFHWYVHTTYNNGSPLNSPLDLLGSPMMKALKRISSCDRGGVLGMIWDVQDCLWNLANANHCADWDADTSPQSWKATTTWETKMREVTWSEEDEHPRFRNEKMARGIR